MTSLREKQEMARLKGVEPLTAQFVAEYSIQLSYKRVEVYCEHIYLIRQVNYLYILYSYINNGGERGIRTLDEVLSPILP